MPTQKLLIRFTFSVLFLGATINVDGYIARASEGGPESADKNSSSGDGIEASHRGQQTRRGTLQRQLRRLSWSSSDRRHRPSIGWQSRAVE